jgi:GxxExxY protein
VYAFPNEEDTMHENDVSAIILDAAIEVHRTLGPGLLESVYEVALTHVLRYRGLGVARQVPIAITFQGVRFDEGFRADIVVQDMVIVEVKSLERLARVHRKQVLTYLKLSGLRLGILINFGEPLVKDGFERLARRRRVAERPISRRARQARGVRPAGLAGTATMAPRAGSYSFCE